MLAAVDAWRHMHTYGFVPGATAAGGRLRTMFDRHGRPEGDPRRSMVAEARRMPARRQRQRNKHRENRLSDRR